MQQFIKHADEREKRSEEREKAHLKLWAEDRRFLNGLVVRVTEANESIVATLKKMASSLAVIEKNTSYSRPNGRHPRNGNGG